MGARPDHATARDPAVRFFSREEKNGSRRVLDVISLAPLARRAAIEEPRLEVLVSAAGDVLVAKPEGDIVSRTAAVLKEALLDPIANGTSKLVIDLSAVRTATRAGIGGLMVASKLMQLAGGSMRLCGADHDVRTLLFGLHLNHLIRLDGSREEALEALSGTRSRSVLADTPLSIAEILCRPSREREERS